MKRPIVLLGAVLAAAISAPGVAAASPATSPPTGCSHVSFTAAGGYYSSGTFHSVPKDRVIFHVGWCYSNGVFTANRVTYISRLPTGSSISLTDSLNRTRSALDISFEASFDSGVPDHDGVLSVRGTLTALGGYSFTNTSGSGG